MIIPADYQPKLPVDRFIRNDKPSNDAVALDVLFVGGGPAGLAGAIELAKLTKGRIQIGVLEKASDLGEHCLSGAIVNPRTFHELFPGMPPAEFPFRGAVAADRVYLLGRHRRVRIPTPPSMQNRGNYVASICEIVRWLGKQAEALGVNIFTGFPAESLLMQGDTVVGIRTAPAGLKREGLPGEGYAPSTDLSAKVTVLCEGTRGSLTQAYLSRCRIASANPAIFSLGVKELWATRRSPKAVIHTLGWPIPKDVFGGSFLYPMGEGMVALGIVASLDYKRINFDVHELLQRLKEHPLISYYLDGGELAEWGAKTIPDGGFYSIPEKLHGNGILLAGDAAGLVNVASLKGIHYAMQSGIFAAHAISAALEASDISVNGLKRYDQMIRSSFIMDDLYETRNMRLAFKHNLFRGGIKAGLMTLTHGKIPGKRIAIPDDALVPRDTAVGAEAPPNGLSKTDAVFRSGNATRDDIPRHLIVGKDIPPEVALFYSHMCPAGVYELQGDRLVVNAPNCIDCKATDVLGPRWTPREGGSGPRYRKM